MLTRSPSSHYLPGYTSCLLQLRRKTLFDVAIIQINRGFELNFKALISTTQSRLFLFADQIIMGHHFWGSVSVSIVHRKLINLELMFKIMRIYIICGKIPIFFLIIYLDAPSGDLVCSEIARFFTACAVSAK